jgi:PRC-barrel domain
MRVRLRVAALAAVFAVLALSAPVRFGSGAEAPPQPPQPAATAPAPPDAAVQPPADTTAPPSVVVLATGEVQGILGREVRSAADEDMGHVVDVLVDQGGQMRAAIIDFGGFLGVGSRKIAVDCNALHFGPTTGEADRITLDLTRDQVKAAPEYKEGKDVVVLGASGASETLQLNQPATPEK